VAKEEFFVKFPQLRQGKFLLFLGRLHEKKGVDLLIHAFADSLGKRDYQLVLAGPCADDNFLRNLQASARDLPVVFTGMLRGNLKWGALFAADVFVLPSHQENFGIAVAEALACGTPVLISNRVNIWREVVADGGGFADEDDLAGTTRLLERWAKVSPAARAEMSAKAQESFARRFEINQAVESLLRVLRNA
jgi:glycosyltransferase involved in cell wall biosynthesis